MDVNQFAVYQLKNIPENRQMRFRPYSALQEKGIQIRCKDYEQVYLGRMQPEDGPERIRKRFKRKKLRQKQAEIAKRDGKYTQQMAVAEDMERRRK